MFHVLSNFIDMRIVNRMDLYQDELEQVKDKEENLDVSKEFLNAVTSVINLRDKIKVAKKKNKKSKLVTEKLDKLYERVIVSTNTKFDDVVALAVAYLHTGLIYTDTKDRMFIGTDYFVKCLKLLKADHVCTRKTVLTVMKALKELTRITYYQNGLEACYDLLMTSMNVYSKYTQDKINYLQPINVSSLLGINIDNYDNNPAILEYLHFSTLASLVELFTYYNPVNMHKLVKYTHDVLKQELLDIPLDFDTPIHNTERYNDWILTLVDLCRYFIYHKRFVEARDHLIVAQKIINCFYVNEVTALHLEELSESKRKWINDMYEFMKAHVATSWGFYAVEFLHTAKENVMKNKRYDTLEPQKTDDSTTLLLFTNLENLSEFAECNTVTRIPKFISNFDDAELVFSESITYYEKAQQFFTEKRSLEIYSQLQVDMSKAYKYIIPLEEGKHKQHCLLKHVEHNLVPLVYSLCKKPNPKLQRLRKAIVQEILFAFCTILDIETDDLKYYYCNKSLSETFNFLSKVTEMTFRPFRKHGN